MNPSRSTPSSSWSRSTIPKNKSSWLGMIFGVGVVCLIFFSTNHTLHRPEIASSYYYDAGIQKEIFTPSATTASSSSSSGTRQLESVSSSNENCGTLEGGTKVYCFPKFIIGGAMKCGTNELGNLIARHPRVRFKLCPPDVYHDHSLCNTKNYFGRRDYDKEEQPLSLWESQATWLLEGKLEDYLERFPDPAEEEGLLNGTAITIDKTPEYLDAYKHTEYPEIIHRIMPHTKMVFTVCDPAERLVSEFFHHLKNEEGTAKFFEKFTHKGLQPPSNFSVFVDMMTNREESPYCKDNTKHCESIQRAFLRKGNYMENIHIWLQEFSPSDILVLDMNAPHEVNARRLVEFADLPLEEYPFQEVAKEQEEGQVTYHNDKVSTYSGRAAMWEQDPEAMRKLALYYAEGNKELADFLNVDYPLQWRSTIAVKDDDNDATTTSTKRLDDLPSTSMAASTQFPVTRSSNNSSEPSYNCGNFLGDEDVYCLPKLIIGGAMKCGTNEAMHLLGLHPRAKFKVCPPELIHERRDECNSSNYQGIFRTTDNDYNIWESTPEWLLEGKEKQYFNLFPETDGINTVGFDKSPQYLNTYKKDFREPIYTYMPGVKMVFTLCDPAERFVSEFYHFHKTSEMKEAYDRRFSKQGMDPPRDFTDLIDILFDEDNKKQCLGHKYFCNTLRGSMLPLGEYLNGIKDWLEVMPRSDLLIIDMTAPPEENTKRLLEFANLPLDEYPWGREKGSIKYANTQVANYTGREALWSQHPEEMEKLASYYAESNKELASFLKEDFPLHWRSTSAFQRRRTSIEDKAN